MAGLTDAKIDGSLLSLVSLVLAGLQNMLETAFLFDTLPLKVSCMLALPIHNRITFIDIFLKFSKDLPNYKKAASVVRKIGRKYIEERISAIKNGDVSDDIMTSAIKENGKTW